MLDKEGNVVVVTEDNASEIALEERRLESEGKDPSKEIFGGEVVIEKKEEGTELSDDDKKLIDTDDSELDEEKIAEKNVLIEKQGKKKEEESEEKSDEELIVAKDEDLNDDEKSRRTVLLEAEEEETNRLLAIKDEDLEGDDIEKKKTVVLKADTKKKEEFTSRVDKYSKEKEISPEESRKTLESAGKIVEKYNGDSEQIAIANLGLQQLVSKKDEDILAVKQEANQPRRPQSAAEWVTAIKEYGLTDTQGKNSGWETVVTDYREKNKAETEDLEDEQVLKVVAKEIHLRADSHFKEVRVKAKSDADDKRIKLVDELPESDKKFASEVKELLKTVPDMAILNKNYNVEVATSWARGRHFTPDKIAELEKAAEEKGFIRGSAKSKIISGPSSKSGAPKSKGTPIWTDEQKQEALDQYPGVSDEKERYKLWKDVYDDRQKNREKKKKT